jgi:hypothetical protein
VRTRRLRSVTAGALLLFVTACAPSAPPAPPPAAGTATPSGPSEQARMVCEPEARQDIAVALGVDATAVGPLRFADRTTTCRYAYPQGAFDLTVQDLPDDATTTAVYDELGRRGGRVQQFDLGVAQAFTTTNGSVVLRKDTKVMLVDVADLPDPFGRPPVPRGQAALLVTKAILGCWVE